MQVLAKITLNFQQPNFVTVYAAKNDRLSRCINAALLDGATPWTIPTGALMTIRYRKPDGTSGWYDTLEDGSPAYTVEEDGSVTFGLAEQALTVPGSVPVELNFYDASGHKLSTLTFIVAVKPSAYSDEDIASSDYYNILTAKLQELAELADSAEGDYQEYLSALSGFVGAPRTAAVAADMLDTSLIYVYTGNETGWTYGDWYYYNGREWTSGGVYNSEAISLDDTLTNANKPAQAKAAGDLVLVQDTQPSAPVNKLWFPLTEPTDEQIPTWDEFSELKSSINQKAPAIVADTAEGYNHAEFSDPIAVKFIGNSLAFKTARYADGLNYVPEKTGSKTLNGIAISWNGPFVRFDGTATETSGSTIIEEAVDLPAGNYTIYLYISKGDTTISAAKVQKVNMTYNDGTVLSTSLSALYDDLSVDIVAAKPVVKISITAETRKDAIYTDYVLWYGIFDKNVTIYETEKTVPSDGELTVELPEPFVGNAISTLQHESIITCVEDTKTYVDTHIPQDMLVASDLIYLSPEMYGAAGNGSVDDTASVQDCVNAAIVQKKMVRGYGRYKTSSTIIIDGSNLDIFLSRVIYTGEDTAIRIAGKDNIFAFDAITATSADTAKGISVVDPTSTDETYRIVINGQELRAKSNALTFSTSAYLLYVVCRIKMISSNLCDAILTNGSTAELTVYDAYFNCPNGWCFNGRSIKLINCTMEYNCNGGVYANAAAILYCRCAELMDCIMPNNVHHAESTGILFKAKTIDYIDSVYIKINGPVYYDSIDLSECVPYTSGASRSIHNQRTGVVDAKILLGDLNYWNGHYYLGSKMLLHGKDRICVPPFRSKWTITDADFDLRDEAFTSFIANRPPYVTDFVVGVADCVIHLAQSYCAEGFNDVTVDMSQYLATIYDRRGNVIFDPTGKDPGKYRLTAVVDYTTDTIYQHTSSVHAYPINSGYCDVWTVEKIG